MFSFYLHSGLNVSINRYTHITHFKGTTFCWVRVCQYNIDKYLNLISVVYLYMALCLNKIWWLCLAPTSTTRFASDVGYRMAKKLIGLYNEIIFMSNDIKFLNIEWRTPHPLTNFEDHCGLCAWVIFLDSNMCGFLLICTLASSQTLVVNRQN